MNRAYAYFSELPVTAEFNCNGNRYVKRSSMTGKMTEYAGRTFYFRKRDMVEVAPYSRLHSDYFNKAN